MQRFPFWVIILMLNGLAVLPSREGYAQQSMPVFATKKDSVEYAQVQQALQEMLRNAGGGIKREVYDSLMAVQSQLRSRIIGYRVIYRPNRDFTRYDSLRSNPQLASSLTQLSINGKEWRKLPREVYTCSQLQELELVNTAVRKLPARLKNLPTLKTIYILNYASHKRMKLAKNKTIKELIYRGVEASLLPWHFKKFSALEDLDLTANIGLSAFPDIFSNPNLKKLNLIGNQITLSDLPDKTASIEYLNVMGNKITHVPARIANFPNLQRLIFSNNNLESIDPAIGQLTQLEELSFYNCNLSDIPESLEQVHSLKQIDLYFNKLSSIKIEFSKLPNLEILYLSNNQLTSIPEDIGMLTNLRELYISNNKLSYLPESMGSLSHLAVLRMNNNYFAAFPYVLLKLVNLENLDISRNDLHDIPAEISDFENLQIFALVDNPWENVNRILAIADALRAKGTIVHLNTLEKAIEN
jgi:Leucine-rich repeat (LRR) protein